jgi:hypothetical protein
MEERRAAMDPNCRCRPAIAAVRVSGGAPDDDPEAEDVAGCVVVTGSGTEDAPEDGCGGGGTEVDGGEVLAMGSAWKSDTRLLELADLRRAYVWRTGRWFTAAASGRRPGGRCQDR